VAVLQPTSRIARRARELALSGKHVDHVTVLAQLARTFGIIKVAAWARDPLINPHIDQMCQEAIRAGSETPDEWASHRPCPPTPASEEALATIPCVRIRNRQRAQILIGGLGMGFTLCAALAELGPDARITVAELVPAVVQRAQGPIAEVFRTSLAEPRVSIREV
jgi:hypothetical protein